MIMDITERKKSTDALKESEEKYRLIAENSVDGIYQVDASGKIVFVNPAFAGIFGYNPEELIGKDLTLLAEDVSLAKKYFQKVFSGKITGDEISVKDKKGNTHFVQYSAAPIKKDGQVIGLTGIVRDVTEVKRAVEDLQESEERYRSLMETAEELMFVVDKKGGTVIDVNEAVVSTLGYARDELIGSKAGARVVHSQKKEFRSELKKHIIDGKFSGEYELRKKDGSSVFVEISGSAFGDYLFAVARDITERKKVINALKESEERYRSIFENVSHGLTHYDSDAKIVDCNSSLLKLSGLKKKDIIGINLKDIYKDNKEELSALEKSLSGGVATFEGEHVTRAGKKLIIRTIYSPIFTDNKVVGGIAITEDISKAKKVVKDLKESEERYRRLAENAPDIIYRFNFLPEPGFEYISDAVFDIAGYTPQEYYEDPNLGLKIIHRDDRPKLEEFAQGKLTESPHITRWVRKDGEIIWIEDRFSPLYDEGGKLLGIEGIARDITGQREAELALMESEERKETLLAAIPDLIFVFSADGTFLDFRPSPDLEPLFSPDEFIGKNIDEIFPEISKKAKKYISRAIQSKKLQIFEYELSQNGDTQAYEARMVLSEEGQVLALVRDVTDRKTAEEEREKIQAPD
jgi:PAS domain S-box-containing protein